MKRIILSAMVFLAACARITDMTEPPFPMEQPGEISTPTLAITSTSIPASSATRTGHPNPISTISSSEDIAPSSLPTESPPLNEQGPYLAYVNPPPPTLFFFLLNPDGSGQNKIAVPDEPLYFNGYSPNGEWVALIKNVYDPQGGISLYLIHLPDGEMRFISNIISPESLAQFHRDNCPFPFSLFRQTAWSPDGSYLAFSANLSGTAFDLFSYDTKQNILRRLTNSTADILSIAWSPDGQFIYYVNGIQPNGYGNYVTYTVNSAPPTSMPNQEIQTWMVSSDALRLNTIVENKYLILLSHEKMGCNAGGGWLYNQVLLVNLATDETRSIWSGNYEPPIAVNPGDSSILLWESGFQDGHSEGYHLASFDGRIIAQLDVPGFHGNGILPWGGENYSYLLFGDEDSGVQGVTSEGQVEQIDGRKQAKVDISSDNRRFVVYNDQGMDLFSRDDHLVSSADLLGIKQIVWRRDGEGLYAVAKESGDQFGLFYWPFSDFQIQPIRRCAISEPECIFYGLTWIS